VRRALLDGRGWVGGHTFPHHRVVWAADPFRRSGAWSCVWAAVRLADPTVLLSRRCGSGRRVVVRDGRRGAASTCPYGGSAGTPRAIAVADGLALPDRLPSRL